MLQVARELLLELGPAATTYTAITARSGITRQTLYRHWPTRQDLLVDIVHFEPYAAFSTPGEDPEHIVIKFLHSLRARMNDRATGAALMSLAAQAHRCDASAAALTAIVVGRRRALNILLADTGRQVSDQDFARLCGPVLYQRFLTQIPVTDSLIKNSVDDWLDGQTICSRLEPPISVKVESNLEISVAAESEEH